MAIANFFPSIERNCAERGYDAVVLVVFVRSLESDRHIWLRFQKEA